MLPRWGCRDAVSVQGRHPPGSHSVQVKPGIGHGWCWARGGKELTRGQSGSWVAKTRAAANRRVAGDEGEYPAGGSAGSHLWWSSQVERQMSF